MTKKNEIIIRPGKIVDKDQVLSLWQEMMDYHRKVSTNDYEMNDSALDLFSKFYETNVRSRNKIAVVAEDTNTHELVGFMQGTIQKRPPVFKELYEAFITDAVVAKTVRGKGIGQTGI
jgi:ribosomal protein S18 acetylase RimI-like enzyme